MKLTTPKITKSSKYVECESAEAVFIAMGASGNDNPGVLALLHEFTFSFMVFEPVHLLKCNCGGKK